MFDIDQFQNVAFVSDEFREGLVLEAELGDFKAYRLTLNPSNIALGNMVREVHIWHLQKAGYRGYDRKIDDACHRSGVYFFVSKGNQVVMTTRVNFREELLFPFELGTTESGESFNFQPAGLAADINTYSIDFRYLRRCSQLLLVCLGRFLHKKKVTRLFCLVDQNNKVIHRIYNMAGFRPSTEFNRSIHFDSFTHICDGKPTRWDILEMGEAEIALLGQPSTRRSMRNTVSV